MANSTISIVTKPVPRDKLAQILQNPRLIRLLEGLVHDVTVSVPTATDTIQANVDDNTATISVALALATDALAAVNRIGDGPPPLVQQLPDIPDDLTGRIGALEARLAAAELLIAELREGPLS